MTTRRLTLLLLGALAVVVLFPGVAFANFGVHGNYTMDTDACAGCHRAHTGASSITWTDGLGAQQSALLFSPATEVYEFCYTCHDATGQGADTNVQEGIYEGTLYGTQFAALNGGGFEAVGATQTITSTHQYNGASWGAWGGGIYGAEAAGATGRLVGFDRGQGERIKMDCSSCHDVHGSSNYRILKDEVFGNRRGGYEPPAAADPDPTPWVNSVEPGYPLGGFRLHQPYPGYTPNYTTPMYAKGTYDGVYLPSIEATAKGMSGWCSGCHVVYMSQESTYDANASDFDPASGGNELTLRHRHPMNSELTAFQGPRPLNFNTRLPLAHDVAEVGAPVNEMTDWIECLTCHRAHGTSAIMTGYADVEFTYDPVPDSDSGGVPPGNEAGDASTLLRENNRYVCEACHNK